LMRKVKIINNNVMRMMKNNKFEMTCVKWWVIVAVVRRFLWPLK
jgi:hypothetical protein